METDILVYFNSQTIIPKTVIAARTKYILYKDIHGRHWQLTPTANPSVMMPFICKPISEEKYNELFKSEP